MASAAHERVQQREEASRGVLSHPLGVRDRIVFVDRITPGFMGSGHARRIRLVELDEPRGRIRKAAAKLFGRRDKKGKQ
jgi:hypothetical protein